MSWISDLLYALGVLGGISDRKIYSGPLTKKEIERFKKEKAILVSKAEEALNKELYQDARKFYITALSLEKINPESLPISREVLSRLKIE